MILRKKRLASMVFAFAFYGVPALAGAQSGLPSQIVPPSCMGKGGCTSICDIAELAQNVLNYGIFLAVVLSAFLFAWAGWGMLTSGGNAEAYAKGKRVFSNVLIGLVIVLAGWIVVDTLMRTMVGGTRGLPWNKICSR